MEKVNDFKVKLEPVFRDYGVKRALLFGSSARGEATQSSDVDLCVDSGLRGMKFVGLMEAVREKLGDRPIDVIDVTHIDKDSRVENEIERTGIVIYEG